MWRCFAHLRKFVEKLSSIQYPSLQVVEPFDGYIISQRLPYWLHTTIVYSNIFNTSVR